MKLKTLAIFMIAASMLSAEFLDGIVARINEEIITDFDVKIVMFFDKQGKLTYESILNDLIDEQVIIASAKDMNYEIIDQEIDYHVDQTIANQRSQFESEEEFLEAIKNEGLTLSSLTENYRKQIKNQFLKDKIIDDRIRKRISITTQEVEDYYAAAKDSFVEGELSWDIDVIYFSAVDRGAMIKQYDQIVRTGKIPSSVEKKEFAPLYLDYLSDEQKNLFSIRKNFTGYIFTDKGLCFYRIIKWEGENPHVEYCTMPYASSKKSAGEAASRAEEVLKKNKEGVSFEELKRFSEEDTEKLLSPGNIKAGKIDSEYRKAFEAVKKGGILTVSTTRGIYLIKILNVNSPRALAIGDVYHKIYGKIYDKKFEELYKEFLKNARADNYVRIYKNE